MSWLVACSMLPDNRASAVIVEACPTSFDTESLPKTVFLAFPFQTLKSETIIMSSCDDKQDSFLKNEYILNLNKLIMIRNYIYTEKTYQKYKTTDGFRSIYDLGLPVISDKNTITNTYNYKYFSELYENNVSTFSFGLSSATSLTNDDIKLSERLYVPQRRLRGFENGKIGPKDSS